MSQPTFSSAIVWLMVIGAVGVVILLWKLLWIGLRAIAL
ncbi:hypothetical protein ACVWYI_004594 [Bradyrhizobium sp. LB13.1]